MSVKSCLPKTCPEHAWCSRSLHKWFGIGKWPYRSSHSLHSWLHPLMAVPSAWYKLFPVHLFLDDPHVQPFEWTYRSLDPLYATLTNGSNVVPSHQTCTDLRKPQLLQAYWHQWQTFPLRTGSWCIPRWTAFPRFLWGEEGVQRDEFQYLEQDK